MAAEIVASIGTLLWVVHVIAGGYVAAEKGRPIAEGAVFGFALGPVGLVIEAMLPTDEAALAERSKRKSREIASRR